MHILFQFDSAPRGGQDAQLVGLLESLVRAGHRGSVVLGAGELSERVCTLIEQRASSVAVGPDMSASEALAAAATVERLATEAAADVLCVASGVSLLVGSLAASAVKRPFAAVLDEPIERFAGALQ